MYWQNHHQFCLRLFKDLLFRDKNTSLIKFSWKLNFNNAQHHGLTGWLSAMTNNNKNTRKWNKQWQDIIHKTQYNH